MAAPETLAAQALGWIDPATKGTVPPVHMSSTFLRDEDNQYRSGRGYIRADNPAFDQAEALLTALEGGAGSLLFASGMGAATAAFLALKPGDHVLAPRVMYWSLRNWLAGTARDWGLETDFVAMDDLAAVRAAVRPGRTKLVWIETPANPLWTITDIAGCAEIAHAAGARLAVDSTAATPVLTRPLDFGADLVMHSATKYLNGHSDLAAGTLTARQDDEYWQRLKSLRVQHGALLGSLEAWLLLRGMRTLFLRVRQSCASAQALAERFCSHPGISAVLYPGLPEAAGHQVAARQMSGAFGAMMSIRVRDGEAAAIAAAARVRIWKRATSLGGVESLLEHRASVEGAGTPAPADLLRLSVGIEATDDLYADLDQALRG
jgi:cystathionine gamma-synthase